MRRRFQFNLRRLFVAMLLVAIALGAFRVEPSDACNETAASILLVHVMFHLGAALLGASIGIFVDRPWTFGAVGAALVLPVAFVIRVIDY